MESILIETTIQQYLEMLKAGKETEKLKEISDLLSSKVQNFTGGFDLHLFQLQKDYLLILAKSLIAMLEFDEEKRLKYLSRAEQLLTEIKKKTEKKNNGKVNEYDSFLGWLFLLKKYFGSEMDRSSSLWEMVIATEQMMKSYTIKPTPEAI